MIFDKTEKADRYLGISKNLDCALHYLMEHDLSALENGTHEIDGKNVFINVMDAVTNPDQERDYEFHIRYYDIQIDLEGAEDVLFGTRYDEITVPYKEDIGFGKCRCEARVHLSPGRFVICEPQEAHLPGISPDGREQNIRKAVIKVRKYEEKEV